MLRMWKTVKAIFAYVAPRQPYPRLDTDDFMDFHMLNEVWNMVMPLQQLD